MNSKGFVFVASVVLLFSCRRENYSSCFNKLDHRSEQKMILIPSEKTASVSSLSSAEVDYLDLSSRTSTHKIKTIRKIKPQKNSNEFFKKHLSEKKELIKSNKRERKTKKEMDPRLSRGLWMTIFGGIAVTLGIVLSSLAPTGLFVFAFGIIFIVGLITLIMYWANPKPKM